MAVQFAPGIQRRHDFFERRRLMGVGAEAYFARAAEQRFKARLTGKIDPLGDRVDEKADNPLNPPLFAVGHRRGDNNIFLSGVAIEQELKGRQQRHK